jgi:4Fe-4S iron-sulfur cluster binding domain/DR2241 stabilising domain
MPITARLEQWLESVWTPRAIGQVAIVRRRELRHHADLALAAPELRTLPDLAALREVVKTNAAGAFRPLRGAPDLPRGWRIVLPDAASVAEALNIVYPAALASWNAREEGRLAVTPFPATAQRQTGMYRLVQVATEPQIDETVAAVCAAGCLRQRLWQPASLIAPAPEELPVYCPEACNFFVAQLRERVAAEKKAAQA